LALEAWFFVILSGIWHGNWTCSTTWLVDKSRKMRGRMLRILQFLSDNLSCTLVRAETEVSEQLYFKVICMNKSRFILVLLTAVFLAACATKPLIFIEALDINTAGSIVINNINDFENLIKKNKIGTVFYTDEYFIVQIDSVFYSHISRGYKSLREYREGKLEKPESWSIFKPGYSN
jgi:hypothetical protein